MDSARRYFSNSIVSLRKFRFILSIFYLYFIYILSVVLIGRCICCVVVFVLYFFICCLLLKRCCILDKRAAKITISRVLKRIKWKKAMRN
jgi:hypothetical protein